MDIEDVEQKRPRFLWIVVVAVVAAALAVFILIQSGRMKQQVTEVSPERETPVERTSGPSQPVWPAADTALAQEGVQMAESASETAAPVTPMETKEAPAPRAETKPRAPARKPVVSRPATAEGKPLVLPTSDAGKFVVQVGSYKDERVAQSQITRMKEFGYDAWVESADIPGKGRYHRVRIGGFDVVGDAERVAESLSGMLGIECWVDNR